MQNNQLEAKALKVVRDSNGLNHPLLPKAAKDAIQEAAQVVAELTRRELKRCQEQETTGNQ